MTSCPKATHGAGAGGAVAALEDEPDNFGSKLWTLRRSKATQENLVRARAFCREALRWMIRDGVAIEMDVQTSYPQPGRMQILVGVVDA